MATINVTGRRLEGTNGNDIMRGGDWSDSFVSSLGSDTMYGGGGYDRVEYTYSHAAVNIDLAATVQHGGEAEGDVLVSIENVVGSRFDDVIRGDSEINTLEGGDGADQLFGGESGDVLIGGLDGKIDTIDGGTGSDWVWYDTGSRGMTITLGEGAAAGSAVVNATLVTTTIGGLSGGQTITYFSPGYQEDILYSIENAQGSQGADTFVGNSDRSTFIGHNGNDIMIGGGGSDQLIGGAGSDTSVYRSLSDSTMTGADRIFEFERGVDKIDLSAIDANSLAKGNQAFHLLTFQGNGAAHFTAQTGVNTYFDGTAGALIVDIAGDVLNTVGTEVSLLGDVNGDRIADFRIDAVFFDGSPGFQFTAGDIIF